MHTFCRYCISQWKNFERIRQIEAGCPVCREPATSEKRNYFADNLIEIMVDCYREEEKNSRKQLVANHQELTQEVLGMRLPETNSSSQATNQTQLMKQIDMQIQDIFLILAERGQSTFILEYVPFFKFSCYFRVPFRFGRCYSGTVVARRSISVT